MFGRFWEMGDGRFLISGASKSLPAELTARLGALTGSEYETAARYIVVSASGAVLQVYEAPQYIHRGGTLEITSLHVVVDGELREYRAVDEIETLQLTQVRTVLRDLTVCERSALPVNPFAVNDWAGPSPSEAAARVLLDEAVQNRGDLAQRFYAKMSDLDRRLCLEWIADAPDVSWRTARVQTLAGTFAYSFDPYYDLGRMAFSELSQHYGPPRRWEELTSDEQASAISQQRVLECYYTRIMDDCRVSFDIAQPGRSPRGSRQLVYAPPCRLTPDLTFYLDRNWWDNIAEMERALLD